MKTHRRDASQAGGQEDVLKNKQKLTRPKKAEEGQKGNVNGGRGLLEALKKEHSLSKQLQGLRREGA